LHWDLRYDATTTPSIKVSPKYDVYGKSTLVSCLLLECLCAVALSTISQWRHDSDFEEQTPRNQKLKKRLSEVIRPEDNSGGTGGGKSRLPLRSVNINDDAAEKRRRRNRKINDIESASAVLPNDVGSQETDRQQATSSHQCTVGYQ